MSLFDQFLAVIANHVDSLLMVIDLGPQRLVLLLENVDVEQGIAVFGGRGQRHLLADPQFLVFDVATELVGFFLLLQIALAFDQRRFQLVESLLYGALLLVDIFDLLWSHSLQVLSLGTQLRNLYGKKSPKNILVNMAAHLIVLNHK